MVLQTTVKSLNFVPPVCNVRYALPSLTKTNIPHITVVFAVPMARISSCPEFFNTALRRIGARSTGGFGAGFSSVIAFSRDVALSNGDGDRADLSFGVNFIRRIGDESGSTLDEKESFRFRGVRGVSCGVNVPLSASSVTLLNTGPRRFSAGDAKSMSA